MKIKIKMTGPVTSYVELGSAQVLLVNLPLPLPYISPLSSNLICPSFRVRDLH
jgi:hypothetical protein